MEDEKPKAKASATKRKKEESSEDEESSSDEEEEEEEKPKANGKRKAEEAEDGEATPAAKKANTGSTNSPKTPKTNTPFQRVNVAEWSGKLKGIGEDNSYWAMKNADQGWGAKAQEVLGQVKGKGFRHEKTKKKRGSYRGGLIHDNQVNSIPFENSDSD
eukprot:877647-Prorocentrum_minimum.AAC.1